MKTELVKVYEVKGMPIYFNTLNERFSFKDSEYESLFGAKKAAERFLEEKYEGEFIVPCYDGICEFSANRKWFSDYDNCWYISGMEKGKYQKSTQEKYLEKDLYPKSKANVALLEKSREMENAGWKMINDAKELKNKLTN